jgi:ADP-ribose pyrophosphatase YjhB (NUDIX family)
MRVIGDTEEIETSLPGDDRWVNSWHPPGEAPDGQPHGSAGFCLTPDGGVVLVSHDGEHWELPGGRPEPGESWEDIFRREVFEETCCTVGAARLLGFSRGRCLTGPRAGLVLVRSVWRGEVELAPWAPAFEIRHRRVVPLDLLLPTLALSPGWEATYCRMLREAGLVEAD